MPRYLAFDLGSSSGRAIVGELGDDDVLATSEIHRFPNGPVNVDGHAHWDTDSLLKGVYEGMRRCGGVPDCIGVDSWGVDYVLLDNAGKATGLPYSYRDSRTEGAVDSFAEKMPLKTLYERTGIQVIVFNSLFQLEAALRDEPETIRSADSLLMIGEYFNYRLTGVKASEYTLASTTHLVDAWRRNWDDEVISALGAPRRLFQKIIEPGTIIGMLNAETRAASKLGRIPVAAVGTHDTGSAVAAVPGEGDDFAYISSGTWSLMGIESKKPIINEASLRHNITNEGGVEGTYRVLKNIGGLWFLQECRRVWGGVGYDELVTLAEGAKPHVAVIDPDWHGFLNPPSMPDAIAEYCAKTGQATPKTRGEIVRIVLEGLALAYRWTLTQLEEAAGRKINRINIVGGGSRNTLLSQLAADAMNKPVYTGPAEATAIGNLLMQAKATVRVRDLDHIRKIVRASTEIVEYTPGDAPGWEDAYTKFTELKELKTE
jgi:sugar (pentulose or hexulose) kinase